MEQEQATVNLNGTEAASEKKPRSPRKKMSMQQKLEVKGFLFVLPALIFARADHHGDRTFLYELRRTWRKGFYRL